MNFDDDINPPLDRGHPFAVVDLWRQSTFSRADVTDPPADSIFDAIDTRFPSLSLKSGEETASPFLFEIPALEPHIDSDIHNQDPLPQQESETRLEGNIQDQQSQESLFDLEDPFLGNHTPDPLPRFCTWERFQKTGDGDVDHPLYLSEAGPLAFDAAYNVKGTIGVLPRDVILRALCSLVLGRSSTLFQFSEERQVFEPVLKNAPVSGTSLSCSSDVYEEFCNIGSTLVKLRKYSTPAARLSRARAASPAFSALQSALAAILDGIEEFISSRVSSIHTILQLQHAVGQPSALLALLAEMASAVNAHASNESVISAVSNFIHSRSESARDFHQVFQMLLDQVSVPWLEKIAVDIGFQDSLMLSSRDEAGYDADDFTADTGVSFMTPQDQALIEETKTALEIILSQDSLHPILSFTQREGPTPCDLLIDPSFDYQSIVDKAREYEWAVTDAIQNVRSMASTLCPRIIDESPADVSELPWGNNNQQEKFIDDLNSLMTCNITSQKLDSSEPLRHKVITSLTTSTPTDSPADLLHTTSLSTTSTIERIRPLILAQHRLTNRIVLRQLFRDHKLLHHFSLHRSFYLFNSAEFTTQLSNALFSPEAQSAERRRGAVITSGPMGLRLGVAGSSWPPASSELCLILIGVLNRVSLNTANGDSLNDENSIDHINFAIRELSDAEIELTMDPHSIHALDMLGLQYTATPPLDMILTPNIEKEYDIIFRFLLLQTRILYLASHLRRSLLSSPNPASNEVLSFSHNAHHFITTLFSHNMDVCISRPWASLESSLSSISRQVHEDDSHQLDTDPQNSENVVSISGLRDLHAECIDQIRSLLLLKRKQQGLHAALESVLACILRACTILRDNNTLTPEFVSANEEFEQARKEFIEMLQDQIDRTHKSVNAKETARVEALGLLHARLQF